MSQRLTKLKGGIKLKRLEEVKRKSVELKKMGMKEEMIAQVCLNRLKTFDEKAMYLKK